jgi:hypothetical protein
MVRFLYQYQQNDMIFYQYQQNDMILYHSTNKMVQICISTNKMIWYCTTVNEMVQFCISTNKMIWYCTPVPTKWYKSVSVPTKWYDIVPQYQWNDTIPVPMNWYCIKVIPILACSYSSTKYPYPNLITSFIAADIPHFYDIILVDNHDMILNNGNIILSVSSKSCQNDTQSCTTFQKPSLKAWENCHVGVVIYHVHTLLQVKCSIAMYCVCILESHIKAVHV